MTEAQNTRQAAFRLTLGAVVAVACIAGLAVVGAAPWTKTILFMWAMACTASGTVIGFLFAVPPLDSKSGARTPALAHPRVERLADWLTGAIIGATLVQAKQVPEFISSLAAALAKGLLGPDASATEVAAATTFGTALVVYFFLMGIVGAYLATRLLLTGVDALGSESEDQGTVRSEPENLSSRA